MTSHVSTLSAYSPALKASTVNAHECSCADVSILSTSKLVDIPQLQTINTRIMITPTTSFKTHIYSPESCRATMSIQHSWVHSISISNNHAKMCATHIAH